MLSIIFIPGRFWLNLSDKVDYTVWSGRRVIRLVRFSCKCKRILPTAASVELSSLGLTRGFTIHLSLDRRRLVIVYLSFPHRLVFKIRFYTARMFNRFFRCGYGASVCGLAHTNFVNKFSTIALRSSIPCVWLCLESYHRYHTTIALGLTVFGFFTEAHVQFQNFI